MPRLTHLGAVLLALLVVAWPASPGSPTAVRAEDPAASLTITPSPAPMRDGEQAAYTVAISGAERLFGVDMELTFDPSVAAVLDADPSRDGVQVKILPFVDPGFVVFNVVDNAKGRVRVTYTQVAPKPAATGSGPLISFDLKALKPADPHLRISAALLAREDGLPQPVTLPGNAATPPPPAASPAPNPTEIPAPTASPGTAVRLTPIHTPSGASGSPALAGAERAPQAESGDEGTSWPLVAVGGAGIIAVIAAVAAGRRYLKRNGDRG